MTDKADEERLIKAPCPTCKRTQNVRIACSHESRWSDDYNNISGSDDHRILQCMGCKTVFFQIKSYFSEDMDFRRNAVTGEDEPYIPATYKYRPALSKRDEPSWMTELYAIDPDLHSLLYQVYGAVNNDLPVLAAIGIRTVFDRASELLEIDAGLAFTAKLDALFVKGKIGKEERDILEALTDAGGAAAHRGWRPDAKQLDTLLEATEIFVYRSFIIATKAKALKRAVPPRPPRAK